jgi:hypothetical protein
VSEGCLVDSNDTPASIDAHMYRCMPKKERKKKKLETLVNSLNFRCFCNYPRKLSKFLIYCIQLKFVMSCLPIVKV